MAKNIRDFLENLFEYYFLNITVSTTTKIDGRDHEIFSKKITGLLNI